VSLTVATPERGPLASVLAEEAARARAQGLRPFVELAAAWCAPSRKVGEMMTHPLVADALQGVHLVRLDVDAWNQQLAAHQLVTRSVPAFYELDANGRPTGRRIDGSAWGEDVPENVGPVLKAFFVPAAPPLAGIVPQPGFVPRPATVVFGNRELPREQVERMARSGQNWFFWIAGFSLVNSVILLSNGQVNFLIGLGATMVVDALATSMASQGGPPAVKYFAFGVDLLIAGTFVVIGLLARQGTRLVFGIGMVLYLLDAVLLALFEQWLNVAVHGFILFSLWGGSQAGKVLRQQQ
jgi:hypothetical protein